MKVKKISESVVRIDIPAQKRDFNFKIHLFGDTHLDSPKCRRDELRRALERAVRDDCFIIISGDLLDLMQLKGDPRASIDEILPYLIDNKAGGYVDSVIEFAAEFFRPYAHRIVAIGEGNHEMTVYERAGVNVLERLAYALRQKNDRCQVEVLPYRGWVVSFFHRDKQSNKYTIHLDHGSGAGGRNKGITKAQDRLGFYSGADLYVSAHLHQPFSAPQVQEFLSPALKVKRRLIRMVQVPTYKDDIGTGKGSWAVKKGHNAQPIGHYTINFRFEGRKNLCNDLEERILA